MDVKLRLDIDVHPLWLMDFRDESIDLDCGHCQRKISAKVYTCLERCSSYYHGECLKVPPRIDRHPLHPNHPLTLGYRQEIFGCNSCWQHFFADSFSFRFDKCEFDLDIGCALITRLSDRGGSQDITLERMNIQHHPLRLTLFSTKHVFVPRHNCTLCLEDVEGDGYMCLDRWCEFLVNKGYSQYMFGVEGTNDPLPHPGHNHRLVPCDSRLNPFEQGCSLCHREISAEAYTCQGECTFYIHRTCAEAPPEIYCGEIICVDSSSFMCDECGSNLDIGCALSTLSYQGGSNEETTLEKIALSLHAHPLTSFSSTRWGCEYTKLHLKKVTEQDQLADAD